MAGINAVDFSTLAVSSAAVDMSDASPALTTLSKSIHGALVTVETDQVRYRIDGTAPTSSEGHLLNAGDVLNFPSWNVPNQNWRSQLENVQFIRVTSDAALKITWYD